MCIRSKLRGFTLVEVLILVVVVSIALIGVLQVINIASRNSADPLQRKQALAIAESLLEEVELARFTFCDASDANAATAADTDSCTITETVGPESGGNGRPFDNVNDYVSAFGVAQTAFNNSGGALADANLNGLGLAGYTATLTITPETLGLVNSDATPANMNVLRLTVTVNYGGGNKITLDGYRFRYAPNSLP